MRILVVTNIPRPYRDVLFNEVARQLSGRGRLAVAFTSRARLHRRRQEVRMPEESGSYTTYTVGGLHVPLGSDHVVPLPIGLPALLRRLRPDVVVSGGFGIDSLSAQVACRVIAVPTVLWSGAWRGGEGNASSLRDLWRAWMIRGVSGSLAYGSSARDYLVDLGAPQEGVTVSTNTVDLDAFASCARQARLARGTLQQQFRLGERNILYVGNLLEAKGALLLLDAYERLNTRGRECTLHLVGRGPLESMIAQRSRGFDTGRSIVMHGFLQQEDVARLMGVCDVFVFPTLQDVWGLVLNEAMACELPVVASPFAGATHDLVIEGANGFVVDPRDSRSIAERIDAVLADDGRRAMMAKAAAETVRARAGLAGSASAFISAARLALSSKPAAKH